MNPTIEFHGYEIVAGARSTILKPINDEDTLIVMNQDGEVTASVRFVNNGINIKSDAGVRVEGNKFTLLSA